MSCFGHDYIGYTEKRWNEMRSTSRRHRYLRMLTTRCITTRSWFADDRVTIWLLQVALAQLTVKKHGMMEAPDVEMNTVKVTALYSIVHLCWDAEHRRCPTAACMLTPAGPALPVCHGHQKRSLHGGRSARSGDTAEVMRDYCVSAGPDRWRTVE